MDPGGKISIRLTWDGARISHVGLTPRRPLEAVKLLRGKDGQQAVDMIPLLFSLCGKAQGVAGVMALEAARGVVATPQATVWRERLVRAEAVQESLWRFLLDVPKIAGAPAMLVEYAQLRRYVSAALEPLLSSQEWKTAPGVAPDDNTWGCLAHDVAAFLSNTVLGMPLQEWRAIASPADMERWLDSAATPVAASLRALSHGKGHRVASGVIPLPTLRRDEMLERVLPELESDENFAVLPQWRGAPAETGALARMVAHPLISVLTGGEGGSVFVRLLARLLEAAELAAHLGSEHGQPWVESAAIRPGVGAAWVQTARGMLIHWLRLDGDRIADYRIVAPTEWNFHPDGAYTRGLTGQAAVSEQEARDAAELLLLALDPCVAYEVELKHA